VNLSKREKKGSFGSKGTLKREKLREKVKKNQRDCCRLGHREVNRIPVGPKDIIEGKGCGGKGQMKKNGGKKAVENIFSSTIK